MSVTIEKPQAPAPAAGEFAPMAPQAIRRALSDNLAAQALWLECMARPDGWDLGNRERIAAEMGWTVYRVRKAISGLIDAGLYVVDRIQNEVGRVFTVCRVLASFAQVSPEAGFPEVGKPARIPPLREIKERARRVRALAGPHSPETCQREADGLPCRKCAKTRSEREAAAAKAVKRTNLPCQTPVADVLAAEMATDAAPMPAELRVMLENLGNRATG